MHHRGVVDLLPKAVDEARGLRWRNDYMAEGGSAAYAAWLDMHQADSMAYLAYPAATAQLGAAEDNMLALHTLLDERVTSIAPYVVARAAIEASGRAFILLDPDGHAGYRTNITSRRRESPRT